MKKLFLSILLLSTLYSYDSRSIGMGGITTVPLSIMGGGQNPAFVDMDNFKFGFIAYGGGFNISDTLKLNLFMSGDFPSLFITPYSDGAGGLNIVYENDANTFSFGYAKHTRTMGLYFNSDGDVLSIRYSNRLTKDSILNFGFVYGHYFGDEFDWYYDSRAQSNLYHAGTSLQTHFAWLDTTIGYEKIVSTSNYFDKSKDTIGYELNNIFGSPFGLQSGVSYVENRFVIPRGISFDYQRGVNDAPDWVLQIMQFPIKSISFIFGIYEYIPTLGQSHKVFDFVFSKNKFDSINVGVGYDGDEQYALNMSYGIAF